MNSSQLKLKNKKAIAIIFIMITLLIGMIGSNRIHISAEEDNKQMTSTDISPLHENGLGNDHQLFSEKTVMVEGTEFLLSQEIGYALYPTDDPRFDKYQYHYRHYTVETKVETPSPLPVESSPVDVVLVLDISGSMNTKNKWESVREATIDFSKEVLSNPKNKLSIVSFGEYSPWENQTSTSINKYGSVLVDWSNSDGTNVDAIVSSIETELNKIVIDGTTPTAIQHGLLLAQEQQKKNDAFTANNTNKQVVILLTDGLPTMRVTDTYNDSYSGPRNKPNGAQYWNDGLDTVDAYDQRWTFFKEATKDKEHISIPSNNQPISNINESVFGPLRQLHANAPAALSNDLIARVTLLEAQYMVSYGTDLYTIAYDLSAAQEGNANAVARSELLFDNMIVPLSGSYSLYDSSETLSQKVGSTEQKYSVATDPGKNNGKQKHYTAEVAGDGIMIGDILDDIVDDLSSSSFTVKEKINTDFEFVEMEKYFLKVSNGTGTSYKELTLGTDLKLIRNNENEIIDIEWSVQELEENTEYSLVYMIRVKDEALYRYGAVSPVRTNEVGVDASVSPITATEVNVASTNGTVKGLLDTPNKVNVAPLIDGSAAISNSKTLAQEVMVRKGEDVTLHGNIIMGNKYYNYAWLSSLKEDFSQYEDWKNGWAIGDFTNNSNIETNSIMTSSFVGNGALVTNTLTPLPVTRVEEDSTYYLGITDSEAHDAGYTKGVSNFLKVNVTVYETSFKIIKKDAKDIEELLSGVVFELTNEELGETTRLVTDGNGEIIFDNLPSGNYTLKEIQPLDGYKNLESELKFNVDEEGIVHLNTEKPSYVINNEIDFMEEGIVIVNLKDSDTPNTGATNQYLFYVLMLASGLVVFVGRKRILGK